MIVKLLTEHHLEFLSLPQKEAAAACPSLHMSKFHIVGNLMPRLKFSLFQMVQSGEVASSTALSDRSRPPDKSVYCKIIFFISHQKHMLWVLKRTVSMRRFF